jgi:hypothetical protein
MPIPIIAAAIGALFGNKTKKSKKEDFVAVKGRKRKDGSEGPITIRRKPKR